MTGISNLSAIDFLLKSLPTAEDLSRIMQPEKQENLNKQSLMTIYPRQNIYNLNSTLEKNSITGSNIDLYI